MNGSVPVGEFRRGFTADEVCTGGSVRLPVFYLGMDTVAAVNGGAALVIQDVVLAEMNTVFAVHLAHMNYLLISWSYDILLNL